MQKGTDGFEPLPGSKPAKRKTAVSQKKIRRIIGIDPGLANTGFGIIDFYDGRYRLVAYGAVTTKPDTPREIRLLTIYNRLCAVIEEFKPGEAGMETLYFARNVTSALGVSEARGVVSLCLAQHDVPTGEYTPNQIKKAVSGNTSADKKLVQKYVQLLLGLEKIPSPDHAADALACAITHVHYCADGTFVKSDGKDMEI